MSLSKQHLSDYQVCHVIGSGSFGTCYKVRHKNTNKFYVWKVIDYGEMSENKKKLLVSEVNVLSELNSKYIVKYHDRIIDSYITTLYIIMEYCPGGDLASLIKKCKRTEQFLEEKFIWKVLYQLSAALQVCHSSYHRYQVLHRDIKPANVFLDEENNVKLGDFGLARVLSWDESHSNTLVGTPYYMSPEVIKGGRYNLKSDIWALGCLIYELCSLKPPFHGDNIKELSHQILDKGFHRIPIHYSEELHHIILYMLSKNNEIRPCIESLLQHPLVVKNTSFWRQPTETITKPFGDFIDQKIIASENPPEEIVGGRDVIPLITSAQNCRHSEIIPNTTNAPILCSNTSNDKGDCDIDPYDEIYGTNIDNETFCEKLVNPNSKKYFQSEVHVCKEQNGLQLNKPTVQNSDPVEVDKKHIKGRIDSVETNIHISYKPRTNTDTKDHVAKTDTGARKEEQENVLARDQLSLIRQIFNSKMHMNSIMQCYSSDENIYMNNKSLLLNKIHVKNYKNNHDSENTLHVTEVVSNKIEDSKTEKQNTSTLKCYLETAIDEVPEDKAPPSIDPVTLGSNTNANDPFHEEALLEDTKDDQIIARCQTLEDKINEILAIQNINQKIKSNHLSEVELLLHEKLDRIRQHEAYIKNKEKQLQNLELNLNKREKCVAMQEKIAQEKIQRAQVYLKQCKDSRRNIALQAPIKLELKPAKENFKMFSNDKVTAHEIDQDKPARNVTHFQSKISKTSLPVRKSKDIHSEDLRKPSTLDNDSSFSADPGDTSILPTMCKLDPDKVKPIKYHRHVHFNDEFIELFNDIGDMCQNKNRSKTLETNNNGNIQIECSETGDTRNNNSSSTQTKSYLNPVQAEISDEIIPTKQLDVIRMKRLSTNTHLQIDNVDDTKSNMINARSRASSVKLNTNEQIVHKTKQMCLSNHHRHSISDNKLHKLEGERKPLSNIFAIQNIVKQHHSRSSGLVGPGFITSTLSSKVTFKDDPIKSAKIKNSTFLGNGNVQCGSKNMQIDHQVNGLTGMKKHFVKSKTSLSSNSNIKQWMRKSMKYNEIMANTHSSKLFTGHVGEGKENKIMESASSTQGYVSDMKQLNSDNLGIIRKQLQPLTIQNYQSKSSFRDILKTQYADLKLSPVTSELFESVLH